MSAEWYDIALYVFFFIAMWTIYRIGVYPEPVVNKEKKC